MKRLIIPTDFSVESLQLIDFAVLNYRNTKLDIVLVCGYRVPDSKWGMIPFSPHLEIKRLESTEFEKAKNDFLKENTHSINHITTELYTGTTLQAFQAFCDKHGITDGLVPNSCFLHFNALKGYDTSTLISTCINGTISVHIEPTYKRKETSFSISSLLKL